MAPGSAPPPERQVIDAASLYVHVPFCERRCGYCDFPLLAGRDHLIGRYLAAIENELQQFSVQRPWQTVFFGGGTPSRLNVQQFQKLVDVVHGPRPFGTDCEVTVEANPNDLNADKLSSLSQAGVNRLSIGVQSFDDSKLLRLERTHRGAEAVREVVAAVAAGWNVSIDLIFGVVGDSLANWQADLQRAIDLGVVHVSTYNLTIEKGTSFWSRRNRGQTLEVDEDLAADLYEMAIDLLTAAGFQQYEVSNFARPGKACRHNAVYWRGDDWLGLGPGAASFGDGIRWRNHSSPTTYIQRCLNHQSPIAMREELTAEQVARERLVFGLRQLAGVDFANFHRATGYEIDSLGGENLRRWIDQGLLDDRGSALRLTRRGLMISDTLWPELLSPSPASEV